MRCSAKDLETLFRCKKEISGSSKYCEAHQKAYKESYEEYKNASSGFPGDPFAEVKDGKEAEKYDSWEGYRNTLRLRLPHLRKAVRLRERHTSNFYTRDSELPEDVPKREEYADCESEPEHNLILKRFKRALELLEPIYRKWKLEDILPEFEPGFKELKNPLELLECEECPEPKEDSEDTSAPKKKRKRKPKGEKKFSIKKDDNKFLSRLAWARNKWKHFLTRDARKLSTQLPANWNEKYSSGLMKSMSSCHVSIMKKGHQEYQEESEDSGDEETNQKETKTQKEEGKQSTSEKKVKRKPKRHVTLFYTADTQIAIQKLRELLVMRVAKRKKKENPDKIEIAFVEEVLDCLFYLIEKAYPKMKSEFSGIEKIAKGGRERRKLLSEGLIDKILDLSDAIVGEFIHLSGDMTRTIAFCFFIMCRYLLTYSRLFRETGKPPASDYSVSSAVRQSMELVEKNY